MNFDPSTPVNHVYTFGDVFQVDSHLPSVIGFLGHKTSDNEVLEIIL